MQKKIDLKKVNKIFLYRQLQKNKIQIYELSKMYIDFFKLNPHVALFFLLEALKNSHVKKKLAILLYYYIKRFLYLQF